MSYKFNPISNKLDFYTHQGIGSYGFAGFTDGALLDPGPTLMSLNETGEWDGAYYLILNRTDKNGNDIGYFVNSMMLFGFAAIYDIWFWVHSKRDPSLYLGLYMYGDDIESILNDGNIVAFALPVLPVLGSMSYDAGVDDYTSRNIPDNDEVILSVDFAFNPGYVGSIGTQDYDEVSISGGSISGTSIYGYSKMTIPVKEDTGDPISPSEGQIYANTLDHLVRIYIDGAWRTLLTYV